ncbi:helix-turn-helix domain-containing protein [Flavisphingomonas formosensis]|uniref:hypothetical protein n=1 Tax=Flavisphingomonas formosensis TaxID=861534 RepID=UPI0012FCA55F|nr:hypothetical protein [Sphingomonas formosensis]
MSTARHFIRNGEDVRSVPYEYKESGLQGIFLHNGYDAVEYDGEQYVSVVDTKGLHRCIGAHIVFNRKELAPAEIKFLRKTMDMTQSELGRCIGQSSQQVARWEKGQSVIPGPADRLLRAIFLLKTMDPEEREEFLSLLQNIEEMDERPPQRLDFCFAEDEWKDAA